MRYSGFLIVLLSMLDSCVDPITISISDNKPKITVDGLITNAPGPYTIRLFSSGEVYAGIASLTPETKAAVTIFDNSGGSELLTESSPGIYVTNPAGIRGVIGREYFVRIETQSGVIVESEPDKLNPGGLISNTAYEYEALPISDEAKLTQLWDYFNVTVDNTAEPGSRFFRWTWEGTYKALNFPQYRSFGDQCDRMQAYPEPCSGYRAICNGQVPTPYPCNCIGTSSPPKPYALKKFLVKVGDCTCCECWVNEYEESPLVIENALVSNFSKIKVARIPIFNHRFTDKYHVKVSVLGLSKMAYTFWKGVQAQKEAAKNIFQPPYYSIPGNVFSKNSSEHVYGLFYAASVDSKEFFIEKTEIPRRLEPIDTIAYAYSCLNIAYSTNKKPSFWP